MIVEVDQKTVLVPNLYKVMSFHLLFNTLAKIGSQFVHIVFFLIPFASTRSLVEQLAVFGAGQEQSFDGLHVEIVF